MDTNSPLDAASSHSLSESSRNTLITTSVIGGTFVVAMFIYVIWKRQKGATYAQILHVPQGIRTPQLTPTPMREKFLKHPIYHSLSYDVRSSRHNSAMTFPPRAHLGSSASNGRAKHTRMQSRWKESHPPMTPIKDLDAPAGHRQTFYIEASPTVAAPPVPEKPGKARISHISVRPTSEASRKSSVKKQPSVTASSVSGDDDEFLTCDSPLNSPPAPDGEEGNRWSWTNSQAPNTPRLHPKSRRASLVSKYSAPRFRSVVSWARGQSEQVRTDEEAPPLLPTPNLQPVPANKRAFKETPKTDLSKKNPSKLKKANPPKHAKAKSSLGGIGAFFKSASNSKSTSNLRSTTDDLESGHAKNDIEMKAR